MSKMEGTWLASMLVDRLQTKPPGPEGFWSMTKKVDGRRGCATVHISVPPAYRKVARISSLTERARTCRSFHQLLIVDSDEPREGARIRPASDSR